MLGLCNGGTNLTYTILFIKEKSVQHNYLKLCWKN